MGLGTGRTMSQVAAPNGPVTARVVVFLDYQNVYYCAREAFHPPGAPSQDGQIDPVRLAELLARRSPFDRSLAQVRVYRGQPDATKDPEGLAAWSQQVETWRSDPRVVVISRPLRYPSDWPRSKPQEKGIDVALAVDLVLMAIRREYDVGIVMSTDTDLKPALEKVEGLGGNPFPRCEVAAWSSPGGTPSRLSLPGRRIWCHWLTVDDYRSVADPCNYGRRAEPRLVARA
jgi:hypothetical protein